MQKKKPFAKSAQGKRAVGNDGGGIRFIAIVHANMTLTGMWGTTPALSTKPCDCTIVLARRGKRIAQTDGVNGDWFRMKFWAGKASIIDFLKRKGK